MTFKNHSRSSEMSRFDLQRIWFSINSQIFVENR